MANIPLKLMIVSGRSGSGKSTVLHILEDLGYNCIDNLPAGLLPALVERTRNEPALTERIIAVSIDARNLHSDLRRLPDLMTQLVADKVDAELLFLDADTETLISRYSETRRRHPLTGKEYGLREALHREQILLDDIAAVASLRIDTTRTRADELHRLIRSRIAHWHQSVLGLLFQSFGFKRGVPSDVDYIFDLRCLPNPYWEPDLRARNGQDAAIVEYLSARSEVNQMYEDLRSFIGRWLPAHEANHRSYLTIALGCTGGIHRSVYMAERLGEEFRRSYENVLVRHRELGS